ncbi:hypothetical protein CDD81_5181 [Ophiocordyceps australis]|uniref:Large ribosomal subunit protein mL46 n=1 Tax=Ophiocordyceps australis TaxID=1399860 RepID=A0A2C5Y9P0_9HYPO|nr:hypothetical protein CDD81_5181 [Ophiocordyceps australis]
MAVSSRGGTIQHVIRATARLNICSQCATCFNRSWGSRRPSSSVAVSALPDAAEAVVAPVAPLAYDVRSSLILTRPPLLTRQLHPFETAFFFYQKRLEERLNAPFITNVYFKDDTVRKLDWLIKIKERNGCVAHDLGDYKGKNSSSWNDELLVGNELSSREHMISSLLKNAETRVSDDAEVVPIESVKAVERPQARETEADRTNDVRRLDRKLDRTLYLILKGKQGWGFPSDLVGEKENLHETAQRVLDQAAGVNMNTWIVSPVPVAHLVSKPVKDEAGTVQTRGVKTFFLKGRIMAGQVDMTGNPFGYTDFKWLTKEELEPELEPSYFHGVRNMMVSR